MTRNPGNTYVCGHEAAGKNLTSQSESLLGLFASPQLDLDMQEVF